MNHDLFQEYLEEYALEALNHAEGDVSLAADYLADKKGPSLLAKHKQEKKKALSRVRKVFQESRDRSAWIALKSLGLDEAARKYL